MKDDTAMLNFVKERLEEGEAISPEALAELVAAAEREARGARHGVLKYGALLAAASLAIVAAGWFVLFPSAPENSNLSTTLALLRVADGATAEEATSLADNLLAWQDAPALDLAD